MKALKKMLMAMLMAMLSVNVAVAKDKKAWEVDSIPVLHINGVDYMPTKSKYDREDGAVPKIDALNEEIKKMRAYDDRIAKQLRDNPKLIPFYDLFEEYSPVFKANDKFILEIAKGYFSQETLKIFPAYFENMLKNFKANMELAEKRGAKRGIDEEGFKRVRAMYEKMKRQHDFQNEFIYFLKRRG